MKLEREPVFGHLTLSHKPEAKSFDYDELSLDSNGLKSGKLVKEFKDDDQLLYLMNDSNGVNNTGELKTHREYQIDEPVALFTQLTSEIESANNQTGFYTDKSAVECEMPELQVCYRESSYSSVKDICVDEGFRPHDKILFESSEKSLCTFVFHDQDTDKEIEKEDTRIRICDMNGLKSSADDQSSLDLSCAPKDHADCDTKMEIENDVSQDKKFSEIAILTKGIEAENPHTVPSDKAISEAIQISSDKAEETPQTATSTGSDSESTAEKLDKDNTTKEASETKAPDFSTEEPSNNNSSTANELAYSSKVEKKRITFDFNPSTTTTTTPLETIKECPKNVTSEVPEPVNSSTVNSEPSSNTISARNSVDEIRDESQNTPCLLQLAMAAEDRPRRRTPGASLGEDSLPGSQFVSGHFQFGESSFSAAGPMSGRINYSGTVPYSGSISHRSDSSTTSTRSFAFPVLPNEWNSSPVRMAKADRRNFRKHRGWRQGILCCRF